MPFYVLLAISNLPCITHIQFAEGALWGDSLQIPVTHSIIK